MIITLSQVKNTLQAHAQNTKRPEYTNYAIRSVHSAILGGIDHPLMDLVIQGQSDAVASVGKKEAYTAKVDLSSRLVRNRIAAEETNLKLTDITNLEVAQGWIDEFLEKYNF